MRLMSWNMAHKSALWNDVWQFDADVALLQEVPLPTENLQRVIPTDRDPWETAGYARRPWRTAIAQTSSAVELRPHPIAGIQNEDIQKLTESRPGTLTVANVIRDSEHVLTVASLYCVWEQPPGGDRQTIWADASAHRLLSDLSQLITGRRKDAPLIAAGDLNLLYGYGEAGDEYWGGRYQTVFDRADALGLSFVGPQYPNGRQADPWPTELPPESLNVPTFCHSGQTPATATRQLDFVFASKSIAERVQVTALNHPDNWGSSDHCQIVIDFDTSHPNL